MGIFDERPFDFNHDGEEDAIETMVGLQMFAGSRQEAIDLTGDDSFYIGDDPDDDTDDEEYDDETNEELKDLVVIDEDELELEE